MDIKDCEIGTRVICTNPDYDSVIPVGAMGTIIESYSTIPLVSFDDKYSENQYTADGYPNCKVMSIDEIEVLKENTSKETNIGKLSVSLTTEGVNSIAKDILKGTLQDFFNYIENLSKDLELEDEASGDVPPKEPLVTEQDVLNNLLDHINLAINSCDEDTAVKLSDVYQRIKSVSF